jgi:hypothetical protein
MTSLGRDGYAFLAVMALACAPLTNDRESPVDAPHPGMNEDTGRRQILSAGMEQHSMIAFIIKEIL